MSEKSIAFEPAGELSFDIFYDVPSLRESEPYVSSFLLPVFDVKLDLSRIFSQGTDLSKLGKRLRGINVRIANDVEDKGEYALAMGRRVLAVITRKIASAEDYDDFLRDLRGVYEEVKAQEEVRHLKIWQECQKDFHDNLSSKDKSRGDAVTKFYSSARVLISRSDSELVSALQYFGNFMAIVSSDIPAAKKEELAGRQFRQFKMSLTASLESFAELYGGAKQALTAFN
ncbi:hypothetical protein [Parvularcula sp. LCG005]|uniref:hypothetical protein n=1 Tax=Parvularcula sp. LCG005 TaxID=3078805 RepID=UPI00294351AB|nr:hypothetical protein [Parvularcula sp. LCG005]WOI54755.1 hypothetical protein RUI03_07055 [Parvularcula sp. LCG005]